MALVWFPHHCASFIKLETRLISVFMVVGAAAGFLDTADHQVYPASRTSPAEHDFRAQASLLWRMLLISVDLSTTHLFQLPPEMYSLDF